LAVFTAKWRQWQFQENGVVNQGREVHFVVVNEVRLFITRTPFVNKSFADLHVHEAQDRHGAAPADAVPGRFNLSPRPQSTNKALQVERHVHGRLGRHVRFGGTSRLELVAFIKGGIELNVECGRHVTQQLRNGDQIRRAHGG
jgi:hypothetical protein